MWHGGHTPHWIGRSGGGEGGRGRKKGGGERREGEEGGRGRGRKEEGGRGRGRKGCYSSMLHLFTPLSDQETKAENASCILMLFLQTLTLTTTTTILTGTILTAITVGRSNNEGTIHVTNWLNMFSCTRFRPLVVHRQTDWLVLTSSAKCLRASVRLFLAAASCPRLRWSCERSQGSQFGDLSTDHWA